MNTYDNHSLKLRCWNINGINADKSHDKYFIDFVNNCHCAFFIESWVNDISINMPDYYTYVQAATKSKRGRGKGGIVIMIKKSIRQGVKILPNSNSHIAWLKFDNVFFHMEKDLYVGVIYVPPASSNQNITNDIWDKLEESILKYYEMGNIMMLGDFNGRTGVGNDSIEYCKTVDCDMFISSPVPRRNSKDKMVNKDGRILLDLCRHTNTIILNGRTVGDVQGQCTSFQYNGTSVIDYGVITREFFKHILYFKVIGLTHLSDHSPIEVCVNRLSIQSTKRIDYELSPTGFKWDSSCYFNTTQSKYFMQKVNIICDTKYDCNSSNINMLCKDVTSVVIDAAKMSLKSRRNPVRKIKNIKKVKWYNNNLFKLKCDVLHTAKLLQRFPHDPHIRGNFIVKKKYYKKACKTAKANYYKNLADAIDKAESKNPNLFWQIINQLKIQYTTVTNQTLTVLKIILKSLHRNMMMRVILTLLTVPG